jgi:bile acid-coenzyme A ligase
MLGTTGDIQALSMFAGQSGRIQGVDRATSRRRVQAIIQPTDPSAPTSAEQIIAYVKDRMAPYKAPKTVEYVTSIRRSEATKVDRARLTEERESPAHQS